MTLTCILIRIKAHLLEDKQISSVKVFDEAKNVTFLGVRLSPNSYLFDRISPKVVPFLILGTFERKITKEAISGVFGVKKCRKRQSLKSPSCEQCLTASRLNM